MLIDELEQILDENSTTSWRIASGFSVITNLKNEDYIPLSCKVFGFNTRHTLEI